MAEQAWEGGVSAAREWIEATGSCYRAAKLSVIHAMGAGVAGWAVSGYRRQHFGARRLFVAP